jgi:hypothetical protein
MLPPNFKATAKLEEFPETRFLQSFERWAVPVGSPILLMKTACHRMATLATASVLSTAAWG